MRCISHSVEEKKFDANISATVFFALSPLSGGTVRLPEVTLLPIIRDLHFSVSKFVSNFETVSNVKILVVNSLNIWDTVL